MAKSDARFAYQAKLSRTDHDLSSQFGFTAAPGQLLPVFADIATPGDSYYINHDLGFMRTAPLLAPSMIDVKVHFESFFVPMQVLYQPFENSMFSLQEILSSNYNVAQFRNQNLPLFNPNEVFNEIGAGSENQEPLARFEAVRLFDMLDLPTIGLPGKNVFTQQFGSFFPWQLGAYQAIFQFYYRLDDKESFNNVAFNFDKYYNKTETITESWNDFRELIKLRYRPWNFDYFTSSYSSPIVSNAGTQGILSDGHYSNLVGLGILGSRGVTLPIGNGGDSASAENSNIRAFSSDLEASYNENILQAQLSTAMIRQMFANEKLAMITGRTRKNYDSQVLAHFGVKVPHDVKHDISFIGHDEYKLQVGEVTSLASTELSPLGDIAGKGWAFGQSKKQHKFTAPCHGVVMTIFSIEPIIRYEGTTNRINFVSSALDIPMPEFDRLGNQPVYRREFYNHDRRVAASDWLLQLSGVWKERYYQYKRRYNRVSMAFTEKPTSARQRDMTNVYSAYFVHNAPFSLAPQDPDSLPGNEGVYYINPWCLDSLMLVSYNSVWMDGGTEAEPTEDWDVAPYLAFSRDPFICDVDLKVKKVSWMSKDGEPIYPY